MPYIACVSTSNPQHFHTDLSRGSWMSQSVCCLSDAVIGYVHVCAFVKSRSLRPTSELSEFFRLMTKLNTHSTLMLHIYVTR